MNAYHFGLVLLIVGNSLFSMILGILGNPVPTSLFTYTLVIMLILALYHAKKRIALYLKVDYLLLFLLMFFVSLFLSSVSNGSSQASIEKYISTTYLIITPSLIVFFLSGGRAFHADIFDKISRKFSVAVIILSCMFFLLGFTDSVVDSGKVSTVGTSNTIWFGRSIALSMLIVLITYNHGYKLVTILMLGVGGYMLLLSGSRGALLGFLAGVLYYYVKPRTKKKVAICVLVIVFFPLLVFTDVVSNVLFVNGDLTTGRVSLYLESFELIKDNFFLGIGYGNYGVVTTGNDIGHYPHNIFLEVFVEAGFLSFLFFILAIYLALYRESVNFSLKAILISMLASALFSGDLTGNQGVFILLAAIAFSKPCSNNQA